MSVALATKSYVQADGTALVVCPECGFVKQIQADRFRHKSHRLKIRCRCTTQFELELEFRRFFRKEVELKGAFTIVPESGESRVVTLTDLSMGGACLKLATPEEITAGTQGVMRFTLDDRHQSEIVKRCTVKYATENRIHCEFFIDKEYERELGFYLRK